MHRWFVKFQAQRACSADSELMKPEEDAFGQELWAFYDGREIHEIVERDDGSVSASSVYPKGYFSEYEDWPEYEKRAIELAQGRVLDIGCGAGRHSLYLQEKGLDVLGIDSSPLAIEICKLRGLRKTTVISLEELDFELNSFDTILMLGNNFSLLGDFEKGRNILENLSKISSESSLIIGATLDPYKTSNPAHLEYHEFNRERGRKAGQIRMRIRFEKYATKWLEYLLVSREEMEELLTGTGWKIREFIDSHDPHYVCVLEKEN